MVEHYTLSDALLRIEVEYIKLTKAAKTTAERENAYCTIVKILRTAPEAREYWTTHPKRRLYRDRVEKIKEYDINDLYEKDAPARARINKSKVLEDGINYDAPNYKGLYLVGSTRFNPYTDEKFYLVKIGKSNRSLSERMREYNTHNPLMWRIDFRRNPNLEQRYQAKLKKVAIASIGHCNEWYAVDRETYLAICEKGFSYFD